jgi:hypothetical protein
MTEHRRIAFRLERDEDGYPPSDYERLWAVPLPNGNYRIDNIPFFVMGISAEDEVSVESEGEELFFKELVKPSGISTFRVIPSDQSMSGKVRADIAALDGKSEFNQEVGVIAVEIPAASRIHPFMDYIVEEQEKGVLDFEEGALRHEMDDAAETN